MSFQVQTLQFIVDECYSINMLTICLYFIYNVVVI